MNVTGGVVYRSLEWITKFAYVNILWFLFTLLGGVVLGLYPATTALFAINREWLKGNGDYPVFKTYWRFYKKDFWKSNLLGLFITAIILLIWFDLWYIRVSPNELWNLTYLPLYGFMVIFTLFLFYIFPAFVHFDLKFKSLIKNTFLIMLVNPFHTFLMAVSFVSLFFLMTAVPALAFIFGASLYAFITMWMSYDAFKRTEKKQKKQISNSPS